MKRCHACSKSIESKTAVGRKTLCPFCGADLHCCLNCSFYASGAYNDCREPQAERVVEKDRSNFCDYFQFRDASDGSGKAVSGNTARSKLESLFKNPQS